ncbi:DUF222 domain-containing protein [Microbacterium plantarum]|uniref:DUF222 domain-containing protein n=1 Tax=Microbacterium plantarum TaxID=1816425 RepID=UPI002B484155|nr:DUF222 domain-containing protein [Microbacterium plantarum]WRK17923.1 DUF222 domain-containing protein [Microbacterium plantarum]
MHSNGGLGSRAGGGMGSDGDVDALAVLVADAERVSDAARAVQVREVRVLAAAGVLAERQAAGASERVKAREMALRGIAAELAGVFMATDRTLQRRIDEARDLVENYRVTMAAWEDGRIVRGHVRVIQEIGCLVPAAERAEFERVAIERCEGETPNRVRDALRMLAERTHSRSFTERHAEAAAGRCVRVQAGPDGMSDLIATLPTVIADGIVDRLTRQAREIINARARRCRRCHAGRCSNRRERRHNRRRYDPLRRVDVQRRCANHRPGPRRRVQRPPPRRCARPRPHRDR